MIFDHGSLGPVQIVWAVVDPAASNFDAEMGRLGDSQLRRYRALDAPRARRFATGRLLLAELIPALWAARHAAITSVCDQCGGDHGRPRIVGAPYAVNISYARDMVIAAAVSSEAVSALGIDIEPCSGDDDNDIVNDIDDDNDDDDNDAPLPGLTRLFSPRLPPGLRSWTEIEAVTKADGRGLLIPPADVAFGGHPSVILPGGQTAAVPGNPGVFEVAAAPSPPGYVVSVAIASAPAAG